MNVIFSYGKSNPKKGAIKPLTQNVYIRAYHSSLDDRRSTGIEVSKEGWDFDNNYIVNLQKGTRTFEESQYLQMVKDKLDKIRQSYENEFRLLKLSHSLKSLTLDEWREWSESVLNKALDREITQKDETPTLIWAYEEFIRIKTRDLAENTIKGYNTHLNILKEFSNFEYFKERNQPTDLRRWESWFSKEYGSKKAKVYMFNETDLDFYRRLRDFNERKGNGDSYFYKIIDNLKSILNYFEKVDHDIFKPHKNIKHPDFKSEKLSSFKPIFTEEEIDKIISYNGKEYLNNLSRISALMYYGCLRINEATQELNNLKQGKLKIENRIVSGEERNYWKIYQQKEDFEKSVPLSTKAKEILLGSNPPHAISQQKFNEYLKEICNELQIEKEGSISSHIFRRSFITNMINRGHSEANIMEYSGHQSERVFREYCKREHIRIKVLNSIVL